MISYNNDSWLFPDQPHETHDITIDDINYLLRCAQCDDEWANGIQNLAEEQSKNPSSRRDFLIEEFRIMNTRGAIIPFPFGDRILTFNSKRQFFRGENQDFPSSVPSLRRKTQGMSSRDEEVARIIANLRIWQFRKLIWSKIDVVPYWEAKICDVNYKALAQHYGFDTYLLDLTNDFRTALFFATCKFDPALYAFRPLTAEEIAGKHRAVWRYMGERL